METLDLKKNVLNTVIDVPILDDEDIKSTTFKGSRVYATGRRKESSARLWLSIGEGFQVNKKSFDNYFANDALVEEILKPLSLIILAHGPLVVKIYSTVKGGGVVSQAGALRLALSKALVLFDSSFKTELKKAGFLTCDAREKEREHYGFRTSRKPQQYKRR